MNVQHFRLCFCFWRGYNLRATEPPNEIVELFKKNSHNGVMNVDLFKKFLIKIQGEVDVTWENIDEIFMKLNLPKELDVKSFLRYLLSDHNVVLRSSNKIHHDMSAPLAHYFIFTGHNSYLTGNQLCSKCSIKPIIKALKKGVRVIELDLWPDFLGSDVIVDHGRTMTCPVKLIKCLRAIRDNAFSASDYPVIITFEDHLTTKLQAKVAKMLTKTFGSMLFRPNLEDSKILSPENLKGKILISTKPPQEGLESQTPNVVGNAPEIKSESDEEASKKKSTSIEIETDNDQFEDEDAVDKYLVYRHLIAIHAGKSKGRLENCLSVDTSNDIRRLSMSEEDLDEGAKEKGKQIVRFTQNNLLRIYPKGTRVFSTNYNFLTGWMHGAQMVAFNMQRYEKHLWEMQGAFRANGGCGYVKKPPFLLSRGPDDEVFDPKSVKTLPIKTMLKVKIYMGEGWDLDFHRTHFDKCSPPDFYTRIGISGVPGDKTQMKKTRTDYNQWNPIWNKEEFEFPLRVPELALLRLEVCDEDRSKGRDFAGQTCLPFSELRTGIRSVPLYDKKGNKYKSAKLLLHINIQMDYQQ